MAERPKSTTAPPARTTPANLWASVAALAGMAALAWGVPARAESSPETDAFVRDIQPLLQTYCLDCHRSGEPEGGLALDRFTTGTEAAASPELWWKVLKNVRAGIMPPADSPRPSPGEGRQLADWIKFEAFGIHRDDPDPGPLTVRRLNRSEYGATVSDLMGIRFDAELIFPAEDSGHGFDNIGDALTYSPLLMEKHLQAAQLAVAQAVPTTTWITPRQEFWGDDFESPEGGARGRSLNGKQPARVVARVQLPEAGKSAVQVSVKLHGTFDFDPARYTVVFSIDGQERSRNEYGWDENKLFQSEFVEDWTAGEHQLAFELTPIPAPADAEADMPQPGSDAAGVFFEVHKVHVEGPVGQDRRVHPANYERFFNRDEPPVDVDARRAYLREVLERFAVRAFRGPVDESTIDRLTAIAERVSGEQGGTFEAGAAQAMAAVLAAPRFLFRMETAGDSESSSGHAPVDEHTLAARLSYLLWSTMPDDELFRLADEGQLRANLSQQAARMLRDEKSQRFLQSFVEQWLRTRDVTQTSVDPIVVLGHQEEFDKLRAQFRGRFGRRRAPSELTPEEQQQRARFRELRDLAASYDADLKRAMRRETEECVEYIIREDRSLLELLDADYTFLNGRLARHYGIPDVEGSEMRRVALPPGSPRGGVLTQASMLLVTSNPTRTSPVKRGLFVLDNILGTPAPAPPAAVPDLEDSASRFEGRTPTLRELLAAHRESALCASCHARMDPLGLALENFNALGEWRDTEQGQPIDASGQLITGESFQDIRELKRILREQHAGDFYRCVTEKLLTYAIGRGLGYGDEHAVDLIVEDLQAGDGRFSVLLEGVIHSAPFQRVRVSRGLEENPPPQPKAAGE